MTSSVNIPRLSFGTWAFSFGPFADDPWDFDRVCRYAAAAGYDGIEINGFRPHPHDHDVTTDAAARDLKGSIDDLGLDISAYAPDFTAAPPADAPLTDYLARFDSALAFCSRLGITTLRTDTISPPGPFEQARFDRLATAWREGARRAADAGVLLVWEFEPGFWLNRPSEVLALVEAVDHPGFGVLFDTSHAYTGAVAGARQGADPELLAGGVPEYASLLGDAVRHLHLIDSDGSLHNGETSEHLPFGDGDVPFDHVIAALGARALDLPWWTVDFCFCPTTEEDGVKAVPYVRSLLERARAAVASS